MSKKAEILERRRRERRRQRLTTIAVIVSVAIIIAALLIVPNLIPIGDIIIPEAKDYPAADGTSMGDPEAPIMIEEFSDFQCSYCRIFHEETLPLIIQEYVTSGEVYFTFHNFPGLGQESVLAANASLCAAEQDVFWEYSDILFANQAGMNAGNITSRHLKAYAEALDLDVSRFQSCLRENRHQDQIELEVAAGRSFGVQTTPSFLINGELVVGAEPIEVFQTKIDSLLSEAE